MDVDSEHNLMFTGSGEGELKAWRVDHEALAQGLRENEMGEVCTNIFVWLTMSEPLSMFIQGHKDNSSSHYTPSFIQSPCFADNFPSDQTLSCRTVP